MPIDTARASSTLVSAAVDLSTNIDRILVGDNAIQAVPELLSSHFDDRPAFLVADENTMAVAGARVRDLLESAGHSVELHCYPSNSQLKPSVENAAAIEDGIGGRNMVPIAIGAGVINDLVKYAAYRKGLPFMSVATAASMDGYASGGAPLSKNGFKHTIACVPPRVIVADSHILATAPAPMAGWGYGDLAGKIPAGADWIIADALRVEAMDHDVWSLVHDHLGDWLSDPAGIAKGDSQTLGELLIGLTICGLAMEFHGSSRPASGADHQIAHIWEMQGITHDNMPVSHGACVAIGTLTILALYDWLLTKETISIDISRLVANRPTLQDEISTIHGWFGRGVIADRSIEETKAKYPSDADLTARLEMLVSDWPRLREKLRNHLVPASRMRRMLDAAGVASRPFDIGLSRAHHQETVLSARFIRRRYTLLDLLAETDMLDMAVEEIFSGEALSSHHPDTARANSRQERQ